MSAAEDRPDPRVPPVGKQAPTKTPMYEAVHAPRYYRQELIKKIESDYGTRLVCYVSGRSSTIDRDDTLGFMELLHNIPPEGDRSSYSYQGWRRRRG